MPKQPLPPLTPEEQAEQVRQFDNLFPDMATVKKAIQACGVTADQALNAHRIVAKKIDVPVFEGAITERHFISEIATDLSNRIDMAILTALQKRVPVATVGDVYAYKDRLSAIQNKDQSTTYYLDKEKLLTIHPPVADFSFEVCKARLNQRIEFH